MGGIELKPVRKPFFFLVRSARVSIFLAVAAVSQAQMSTSSVASINNLKNAAGCSDTSVSANTITCSTAVGFTGYAALQAVDVLLANTVTGATTININGLGAKAVTYNGTNALTSAIGWVAGSTGRLVYDGTRFVMEGIVAAASACPGGSAGQVQFNVSAGVCGGDSNLTWDNTTKTLAVGTSLSFDAAAGVETGADISTPANPSASHTKLYPKGGVWCSLSPVGVENCLGAGGGSPGGSSTELQYRFDASTFGGMAGTSWDNTTRTFALVDGSANPIFTFSADPASATPFSFNANRIAPASVVSGDGTNASGATIISYFGGNTTDAVGLGGTGGDFSQFAGTGGAGPGAGGGGGQASVASGAGGSTDGAGSVGGAGGFWQGTAGDGGASSGVNGLGGGGATALVHGGAGGNAPGAGGVGGAGGNVIMQPGAGGTGAGSNGADGVISMASVGGGQFKWSVANATVDYTVVPPLAQGTGVMTNDGSGNLSFVAGSAGQASCWKTNGQLSYCESVVGVAGACTCH